MELGNGFSPIHLRSTAIRLIETIKISRFWQVIPINDDLFDRGFAKFNLNHKHFKIFAARKRAMGQRRARNFSQAEETSISKIDYSFLS